MDDEQLLEFTPEQAEQQLNDDQLERYNDLKVKELQEGIDEKQKEDGINSSKGLANLREATEKDLTVEVHGIEFLADIEPSQINQLAKVAEFEDRKLDSLEEAELETVRSNLLDVLAELSTDFDRNDWQGEFGDAGLVVLGTITGDLLDKIENFMEQKKSR